MTNVYRKITIFQIFFSVMFIPPEFLLDKIVLFYYYYFLSIITLEGQPVSRYGSDDYAD